MPWVQWPCSKEQWSKTIQMAIGCWESKLFFSELFCMISMSTFSFATCRMLLEGKGAVKANHIEAFVLLQKVPKRFFRFQIIVLNMNIGC